MSKVKNRAHTDRHLVQLRSDSETANFLGTVKSNKSIFIFNIYSIYSLYIPYLTPDQLHGGNMLVRKCGFLKMGKLVA